MRLRLFWFSFWGLFFLKLEAHEHAVFYKTPTSESGGQYQAYCNLTFGRVFFSGANTTFSTTNSNHHNRKAEDTTESFRIRFSGSTLYDRTTYLGQTETSYTRFANVNNISTSDVVLGYSAISTTLSGLGIQQRWLTNKDDLAFDFLGKANAKWDNLSFSVEGLSANLKGSEIILTGKLGHITITAPVTRVKKGGQWLWVPSYFVALPNQTFAIRIKAELGNADSVWVDPRLVFSGYSGSTADNWGTTATYDSYGNTYVAGITFGLGFPTTLGAFQTRFNTSQGQTTADVVIQKFSPNGRLLLASSYLGGRGNDVPHSIVVNKDGDVIIFGTTGSNNFPTTPSSHQPTFRGGTLVDPYEQNFMEFRTGSDFFITRLDSNLSRLLASTYLGGTANEGINECSRGYAANYGDEFRGTVDVDSAGLVYIAGSTRSANFPISGGFQPTFGGGADGVLAKLSPSMNLLYSTYIGGEGEDVLNSLTLGPNGKVGFCGASASTQLPTTRGSYQPRHTPFSGTALDNLDAFAGVAVLTNGARPNYLTFSGTNQYDQAYFADFDFDGQLCIMGQTRGNMPYSPKPSGSPNGGLFIQRFNSEGSGLTLAYRFGSRANQPNISPTAFQIDICGQIYFSGWAGSLGTFSCDYIDLSSTGLPVTSDAVKSTTDGNDFYVAVLFPDANELKFGTFFGAFGAPVEHVDGGTSRFDPSGYVYQAVCAGCGGSSVFPATPGVYSTRNRSSNCNQAAFKINLTPLYVPITATVVPQTICQGQSVVVRSNARKTIGNYIDFGDGLRIDSLVNPVGHRYLNAGLYNITIKGNGPACPNLDSTQVQILVREVPMGAPDTLLPFCEGDTISIVLPPNPHPTRWIPSTYLSTDTGTSVIATPSVSTNYKVVYSHTVTGCRDTTYVSLMGRTIPTEPIITIQEDSCRGITSLRLSARDRVDSTRWTLGNVVYEQDTVFRLYTQSTADTLVMLRIDDGCRGLLIKPITIPVKKVGIPLSYTSDSSLTTCTQLGYTLRYKDTRNALVRWYAGDEEIGSTATVQVPSQLSTEFIKLLAYRNGCADSVSIPYKPSKPFVPNLVTENGDSQNEKFTPLNMPKSAKLNVYDRWGKTILRDGVAADGFNFINQEPGVYYYVIQDVTAGYCRGWVEVQK